MGLIQLRTIAVIVLGFILSILISSLISWWLLPLLLLALFAITSWLIILDVKAYIAATIVLIQNPKRILADSGLLTSQLPFWLKPFGNRIVSKYAEGDYDERISRVKTTLKSRRQKQ